MKKIFTLILALYSLSAWAHDFEVNGIYYNILDENSVAVTYRGDFADKYEEYSGAVTIPASITYNGTTYSVTSIGNYAFYECSGLTSVTIGNSVTSIGDKAFYYCSSLTSITIPNSVTSIGSNAFRDCSRLTSVTIGNSVTSIGSNAFRDCSSLTSITIPNSVTSIGDGVFLQCSSLTTPVYNAHCFAYMPTSFEGAYVIPDGIKQIAGRAFYGRSKLTSITIPNSVTSIGDYAFCNCSGLTSITIPNSVTSIREGAFYECTGLTSITIPNSVTSIGNYAFYECSGLTSVTIGNSVRSIGLDAFLRCYGLTSIVWNAENCADFSDSSYAPFIATYSKITSFTFGEDVKHIPAYLCYDMTKLTSITIGNSVTSIGNHAFRYCSSLTKTNYTGDIAGWCDIKFGGSYANPMHYSNNFFINDQEIKDLVIPNSVTSIGDCAFFNCSSLTSVTIPNSVTSIGDYAFYGCSSLPVENNLRYADTYLVGAVARTLSTYSIKEGTKWIGGGAFDGCSKLTSVTIPNSVTSIGNDAFEDCSSLSSITIPNSVTSIGDDAFSGCSSLRSVVWNAENFADFSDSSYAPFYGIRSKITSFTFGEDVKHIPAYMCYGMSKLTSFTIPNSVTSIGGWAFYNCSGLSSVTIPNSVTSIGDDAFYGCSCLRSVVWNAENCANFSSSSYAPFYDICSQITSFTLGEDVKHIPAYLCYDMTKLTSITIGNSVTSIGNRAFLGCSGLTSLTIPNSVTSIGEGAFRSCSGLTSITIPNSVTSIGDGAFYWCSGLTSITIPNSVTSIGGSAFYDCYRLTSVTIGNSVTSIGDKAFYYCSGLTSIVVEEGNSIYDSRENCNAIIETNSNTLVAGCKNTTIPNSVTSIGNHAFYYCRSLTSITIPNSVTSIGDGAFKYCEGLSSVYVFAEVPPTLGTDAFYNVSTTIPVYVPCGSVSAYQSAEGWKKFTNIQVPLAEYSIAVGVNDNKMGTAKVDENTICGAQISATANYGYHVVQWSDGITENPRTLELTQDTILTAEFAQSFSGQCGDNLYWSFNDKTLTITGFGAMWNERPWGLFVDEIQHVVLPNAITHIGDDAFSDCTGLNEITIPYTVTSIGDYAFAGCRKLVHVNCYAINPPMAETTSFANYNAYLNVPCDNLQDYQLDMVFGSFKYIQCMEADSENVPTDDVVVTPGTNDVTITWPTAENANTYSIEIKRGDVVFCTLTFDKNGMLTNIAFAPSRSGSHPVTYAASTGNGLRFTVTSLDAATTYGYNVTTKDEEDNTLSTYSGEFTTKGGTTTAVEDVLQNTTNSQKLLRNGQLIILRDGKTYTTMGAEIQ